MSVKKTRVYLRMSLVHLAIHHGIENVDTNLTASQAPHTTHVYCLCKCLTGYGYLLHSSYSFHIVNKDVFNVNDYTSYED